MEVLPSESATITPQKVLISVKDRILPLSQLMILNNEPMRYVLNKLSMWIKPHNREFGQSDLLLLVLYSH